MGLHFKDIKYFEEMSDYLKHKGYVGSFNGLRLCELGDLWIRSDLHNYMTHRLASQYFESKGFEVDVIDLGIGTEDIVSSEKRTNRTILRYDLSKPITKDIGKFDFIVDFGTAEHIENQYEFNKNIHNLCKVGGIIIRSNPSDRYSGGYPAKHHGLFHYTHAFYVKLSQLCKYKIVDIREMAQKYWPSDIPGRKNFTYVTMIKSKDVEFPSLDDFNKTAAELGWYGK
jgi:hypothetical protein